MADQFRHLLEPAKFDLTGSLWVPLLGALFGVLVGTAILFLLIRRFGRAGGALTTSDLYLGFPLALCAFILPAFGPPPSEQPLIAGIIQAVAALAIIGFLAFHPWRTKDEPPAEWYRLKPKQVLIAPLLWLIAFPVIQLAMFAGVLTLRMMETPVAQQNVVESLRSNDTVMWILGWYVMAVIAAPLMEEFVFRVVIFGGIRRATDVLSKAEGWKHPGTWIAAAVSIGLFVVAHGIWQWPVGLLPMTVLSLILTLLYVHTKSIWPGVVFHACHNAFVVTMQFFVLM